MILDYYEGELDGDTWEKVCQDCYRIRYQNSHYTEVPANFKGDYGIEGFTRCGVVIQCKYPEKEYNDDKLYEVYRDKLTEDINKLMVDKNIQGYKNLGVPVIKEWHFVIPEYKDKRIIEHANRKKNEVLEKVKRDETYYNHISKDFDIIIKQAEDFKIEISRIIRKSITEVKLNLTISKIEDINWDSCSSEKISNVKRKVSAIMGRKLPGENEDINKSYIKIVSTYIESYLKGLDLMNKLRTDLPDVFKDIHELEQVYKKEVMLRTNMNLKPEINQTLFQEIIDDFENKLENELDYLTTTSISELKIDLVSKWLADCSMEFRI